MIIYVSPTHGAGHGPFLGQRENHLLMVERSRTALEAGRITGSSMRVSIRESLNSSGGSCGVTGELSENIDLTFHLRSGLLMSNAQAGCVTADRGPPKLPKTLPSE